MLFVLETVAAPRTVRRLEAANRLLFSSVVPLLLRSVVHEFLSSEMGVSEVAPIFFGRFVSCVCVCVFLHHIIRHALFVSC